MKSKSVTIQMKAAEQCFPVVLLFIPCKFFSFEAVDENLVSLIQMEGA